jgi:cytochrome c oxidase cbb3-type subunit III
MKGVAFLALCALGLTVAACERERRPFEDPGSAARRTDHAAMTPLVPGSPPPGPATAGPFRHNAYGVSEGKRLFASFNCVGCHSHGGGGMGPALMDDEWIYGSHAENIFNSILEGRPNGMPAWRGKIPDEQVWQIVAYVQSMNGQEPIDVLPGRDDHLRSTTPENLRPAVTPVQTGTP